MDHRAGPPTFLASDLDGTLIPGKESSEDRAAVEEFRELARTARLGLAYVTGRHLALALEGVRHFGLPNPVAVACDVGTSVYWRGEDGFVVDREYGAMIGAMPGTVPASAVHESLADVPGITPQEPEKQAAYKVSFYAEGGLSADLIAEIEERLAALGRTTLVPSLEAQTGRGLLDVLPERVGKATAVAYLRERFDLPDHALVFAGDSGNDRDALLSSSSIVVANAPETLKAELRAEAGRLGREDRLYFARSPFALGVVEGLRHFGVRGPTRAGRTQR